MGTMSLRMVPRRVTIASTVAGCKFPSGNLVGNMRFRFASVYLS